MADVVGRLQKIRKETHIAQDLLEYAVEDVNNKLHNDKVCLARTASILGVLQDRLCKIDGMQRNLLMVLTEEENAPAER